jgi:hypothetical protein
MECLGMLKEQSGHSVAVGLGYLVFADGGEVADQGFHYCWSVAMPLWLRR